MRRTNRFHAVNVGSGSVTNGSRDRFGRGFFDVQPGVERGHCLE